MVIVVFHNTFRKVFKKIRDSQTKERIAKQLKKIKDNPEVGKPMGFDRKGTREVYVAPFRLSYIYVQEKDTILILDLYHKDEQ